MKNCSDITSLKNYQNATLENIKVSDEWTITDIYRTIGSTNFNSLGGFIAHNLEKAQEEEGSLIEKIIIKCQNHNPVISVNLSKQGREYIEKNISDMLDEYNTMTSKKGDPKMILFTDIEAERKDIISNNGYFDLVNKSPETTNSLLHQNTFSSAPVESSGDCQTKRVRDKMLVGGSDYKIN